MSPHMSPPINALSPPCVNGLGKTLGVYIDMKEWPWELALQAAKFKKEYTRLYETAVTSYISKMKTLFMELVNSMTSA